MRFTDRALALRGLVDLITDASSIINLANAGALDAVAALSDWTICISPLVISECEPTCAAELLRLQQDGLIKFVDPQDISSERFLTLLVEHDLGEGETECLALLQTKHYVLCCDDDKARRVGIALVGADRVVGSLRLLKWAVADGICTSDDAFDYYERMKAAGGFLPELPRDWFEAE
jgi:predicted nucleic acid-binding protein